MPHLKILISLLFLSLFLFPGCKDNIEEKKETVTTSQINLSYQITTYTKKSDGCSLPEIKKCAEIILEFPVIYFPSNKRIEDTLNDFILTKITKPIFDEEAGGSIESKLEKFILEYEKFIADFPQAEQQWEFERIGHIRFFDDDLICIEFSEYSYLGGAHPNSLIQFANFDLHTGRQIQLKDLFVNNFSGKLNSIAEVKFREISGLKTDDDLNEAGYWFDNNRFSVNKNFALDENGITFYFNNYEITAYAYGPTELFLPYKEIKHLIDSKSLLFKFIN